MPTPKSAAAPNVPSPFPERQVEFTVPIEIRYQQTGCSTRDDLRGLECPVRIPEQNGNGPAGPAAGGHDQIGVAVLVEVSYGHELGIKVICGRGLEGSVLSTALRAPAGGTLYNTAGIATKATTGKGSYLYVAEIGAPSAIAVMEIPASGCPTELSGSPFADAPVVSSLP